MQVLLASMPPGKVLAAARAASIFSRLDRGTSDVSSVGVDVGVGVGVGVGVSFLLLESR